MQLGTEVKAGDVLVRLEPRELQFALDRAESALRQVEAQLGIDRAQDKQPPADEQIASVRQAMANRDDARSALRAGATAERPRPADAGRSRHRRDPPQGRRGELPGGARHRAQPEGQPAGSPRRRTTWRGRSSPTRSIKAPVAGVDLRAAGAAGRVHPREHAGRHDRPDDAAQAADRDSGKEREPDPAGPGGRVRRRGVPRAGRSRARSPTSARRSIRRRGRSRSKRSSTTPIAG